MSLADEIKADKNSYLFLSRASTAIYLTLLHEKIDSGRILVPANICYAAIYPALYAGMQVKFCDVDAKSGNVTPKLFLSSLDDSVEAAIIPHMYGNPVTGLNKISRICKEKGIILIEDCASAMGAVTDEYELGKMGDYVIYSTGYSKTLDIGYGGILYSKRPGIENILELEEKLPFLTDDMKKSEETFSKVYRTLRNAGTDTSYSRAVFDAYKNTCRDVFLHKITKAEKENIYLSLDRLPGIIRERREGCALYSKLLSSSVDMPYDFSPGAVPWRYNFFVEKEHRSDIIKRSLEKSIPISDWYPPVTNMFEDTAVYPGCSAHGDAILNLPLMISKEKIIKIAEDMKVVLNAIQQ